MASKGIKDSNAKPVARKPQPARPVVAEPAPVVAKAPKPAPAAVEAPVVEAPTVEAEAQAVPAIIEAAQADVTPAAEAAADIVQKEETVMATTFETPKFETPKMFGDMNERAKSAMEKSGKLVQELSEFNKGNIEALVESSKITAKGLETLGQDAAEYGRKSFEGLTATLKSLATVKSPTDLFKLHSDYVRASFDAAVAQGSKSTEAMIKLAGDAAQPISNRFALAAEKVKSAA